MITLNTDGKGKLHNSSKFEMILGLVLIGLLSSLIFVSAYSNNTALGQIQDGISLGPESTSNHSVSNANPLTPDQIPAVPQQGPPSGFVAKGTINSIIFVPTGKWIAVGNWSMTLNNGNISFFETNMVWYNSSGTAAHTHELVNFSPASGEQVVSLQQPSNNIVLKGVTDVGTNNRIVWNEVPTTISINGHKIITISIDDNKTNHHFAGQPILGIVSSFFPCSDLPGPDMEVLPPCTVSTFQENNFSPSNETLTGLPSEDTFSPNSVPSQDFSNAEGLPPEDQSQNSVPSEDALNIKGFTPPEDQSQNSVPSQDVPGCEQVEIRNIKSSGFESDPADYHPPSDSIDGDSSTWWANQGKNSLMEIDLGEPNLVCGISVEWNKGDVRKYNFEITVSEDGNDFKKVFEGTNQGGTSTVETYKIDQINGRYINLDITSNSPKGWVSIKEINVLGRPIA
jgi:hypothetical protein